MVFLSTATRFQIRASHINMWIVGVSDSVNRGTSTSRRTRKPVQLVVYKRGSKAKEKERGGQAAPLEVIYDLRVT